MSNESEKIWRDLPAYERSAAHDGACDVLDHLEDIATGDQGITTEKRVLNKAEATAQARKLVEILANPGPGCLGMRRRL